MEKTKFAILVGLLLALFFFVKMDADASSADSSPSYSFVELYRQQFETLENNYSFKFDIEGVTVNDGTYVSYVGDTAVLNLDCHFGSASLNLEPYFNTYDYFTLTVPVSYSYDLTYNDYSNGLNTVQQTLTHVIPYVSVNGIKRYLSNDNSNTFVLDKTIYNQGAVFGCEVQILVSYSGANMSESSVIDYFGTSTLNLSLNSMDFVLSGVKYVSTGEAGIIDRLASANSWLNAIYDGVTHIKNKFDISLSSFRTDVREVVTSLARNMKDWFLSLENKLDEVIETLTQSYDSSSAKDTNSELSGSLDSWEAAEGATMNDAKIDVSSYDTSSAFNFAPALISSLSLVTAFSTGFLNASGDFTTAITVMFSLVFVSVLVGLVRFVRR